MSSARFDYNAYFGCEDLNFDLLEKWGGGLAEVCEQNIMLIEDDLPNWQQ